MTLQQLNKKNAKLYSVGSFRGIIQKDRTIDQRNSHGPRVNNSLVSKKSFVCCSQLNGANGEATNSDDVNKVSRGGRKNKNLTPGKLQNEILNLSRAVSKLKLRGPVYGTRMPKAPRMSKSSSLHPVEHNLIRAMLMPTDLTRPKHGLFTMPHDDSSKFRANFDLDVVVGTAGIGFIALTGGITSDAVTVFATGATFAGSTIATSGTGITGYSPTTLPYTTSQLDALNLKGRLISSGAHGFYTGKNQDRSGMCYGFSEPNHASISGQGVTSLSSRKQCSKTSVTEESEFHVSIHAVQNSDLEYTYSTAYPYGSTPSACLLFQGVAGTTFHCTFAVDVEYVGILTEAAASSNPMVHSEITRNVMNAVTKAKEIHSAIPTATRQQIVSHAQQVLGPVSVGHLNSSVRKGKKTMKTVRKIGKGFREAGTIAAMFA